MIYALWNWLRFIAVVGFFSFVAIDTIYNLGWIYFLIICILAYLGMQLIGISEGYSEHLFFEMERPNRPWQWLLAFVVAAAIVYKAAYGGQGMRQVRELTSSRH